MTATIWILSSLLVASLCSTGTLFLKWWKSTQMIAKFKKENDDLQRKQDKEISDLTETVKQVKAESDALQVQHKKKIAELYAAHPIDYRGHLFPPKGH